MFAYHSPKRGSTDPSSSASGACRAGMGSAGSAFSHSTLATFSPSACTLELVMRKRCVPTQEMPRNPSDS